MTVVGVRKVPCPTERHCRRREVPTRTSGVTLKWLPYLYELDFMESS